jgi:hypothetical protein
LWHVANWENDSLNHWDFGGFGVPKFWDNPMYTYLVIPFYGQQVRLARTQCHQVTRSPRKMVKAKVGMVPAAEWMLEK